MGFVLLAEDQSPLHSIPGDWSHLSEWDRPPAFIPRIITGALRQQNRDITAFPDRAPIEQKFKGKPISDLKGLHSGKCAILFNGETLANHDLWEIRKRGIPIIGMNRTHVGYEGYKGPQPDYLCVVDHCWLEKESVRAHPFVINGSTHLTAIGYRATRCWRQAPFALDMHRDGFVPPVPCTTGFLALQLAHYLGFSEAFCLGLDLGGGHFDGTEASKHMQLANTFKHRMQKALTDYNIPFKITICGSPNSACTAFPHSTFEELIAGYPLAS